jgi:hypothetical protein
MEMDMGTAGSTHKTLLARRRGAGWRGMMVVGIFGWAAGCGDPCRDLSLKVCDCKLTPALVQQCISRVNTQAAQRKGKAGSAAASTCAAKIDGCSCEKLIAGDGSACGLSREDLASP